MHSSLFAGVNRLNAMHRLQTLNRLVEIDRGRQINGGKGAKGPVVHHIGIGDGQYHPRHGSAQPSVKPILQINDLRQTIHAHFGIHAVVSGQGNDATHVFELLQITVHHGVEGIGPRSARCKFMLDVVGGGQIHHIRPLVLHQPHTSGKHKFRQVSAVNTGQGLAHFGQDLVYAVFSQGGLVRFFGGKANALHLMAQQLAQLVLGRDHRHLLPCVGQGGQNGGGAQPFGVIHHDL